MKRPNTSGRTGCCLDCGGPRDPGRRSRCTVCAALRKGKPVLSPLLLRLRPAVREPSDPLLRRFPKVAAPRF
jgi:hypothetical protein